MPLLIFSILFGVAIGATTFSSKTQIEHWQHAVFGLPYGQTAFATYCAMSRRPGRRNAVMLSLVAVLIWNAVMFMLLVQVQMNLFLSFSHTISLYRYQLFARTNTEFLAIVVWLIVATTYVMRS
ncbi:MAG: hypothetical protein SGJ19_24785 [Planctomycetia bacterium]|nr:hypothetical protein [Planctomycetia bacterium]